MPSAPRPSRTSIRTTSGFSLAPRRTASASLLAIATTELPRLSTIASISKPIIGSSSTIRIRRERSIGDGLLWRELRVFLPVRGFFVSLNGLDHGWSPSRDVRSSVALEWYAFHVSRAKHNTSEPESHVVTWSTFKDQTFSGQLEH